MQVKTLSREEYEVALEALGVDIPVEQLPVWQDFESTVDGRSPCCLLYTSVGILDAPEHVRT